MKFEIIKDDKYKRPHRQTQQMMVPSDDLMALIEATFNIVQNELGLAQDPRTVRMGFFDTLGGPEGETKNDSVDPVIVHFAMDAPFDLVGTICHEMVHVRDITRGDLKFDHDADAMFYKGRKVNSDMAILATKMELDMLVFPWEKIAYDSMFPLALTVLKKLPAAQLSFLNSQYAEAMMPPSLTAYYEKKRGEIGKIEKKAIETFEASKQCIPALSTISNYTDILFA